MKNFRTLCASAVLVLYALLAGASIDDNGDFEGWFIFLCIIVPVAIIIAVIWMFSAEKARKEEGRRKVPKTYTLEFADSISNGEFYYDAMNKKVLALAYDTSNHKIIEIPNVIKSNSFYYRDWYFMIDETNKQLIIVNTNAATITHRIIPFYEIQGVEISENGTSVFRKDPSVGRALVGGVLFGGVGAIIGGTSGKTTETKEIDSYKMIIQLSNINCPTYEIEFIDEIGFSDLKIIKECVNQLKSTLLTIIKSNEFALDMQKVQAQAIMQAEIQQNVLESKEMAALEEKKNTSIADELLKLSELHKTGVLTDAEYETLKKKLL